MDLEHDAFRVTHDPAQVSASDILDKIRSLGYIPREDTLLQRDGDPEGTLVSGAQRLALLKDHLTPGDAPIFLDFYASWCGPCLALEKNVLSSPLLAGTLDQFTVVKIDTDQHPHLARSFGIKALPTLVVLDTSGNEQFRQVGPITVQGLMGQLNAVLEEADTAGPKN